MCLCLKKSLEANGNILEMEEIDGREDKTRKSTSKKTFASLDSIEDQPRVIVKLNTTNKISKFQLKNNSNLRELELTRDRHDYFFSFSMNKYAFFGLSNLTTLKITSIRNLFTLPEGLFSGLTNLKTLAIFDTSLINVPDNIFSELSNLIHLELSVNFISKLPKLNGLTNIRFIYIIGNEIKTIPEDALEGLTRLKRLTISNTKLSSIPETLFRTNNELNSVILAQNKIKEIPADLITHCSQLVVLDVSGNGLTEVPDKITQRRLSELKF